MIKSGDTLNFRQLQWGHNLSSWKEYLNDYIRLKFRYESSKVIAGLGFIPRPSTTYCIQSLQLLYTANP